MARQPRTPRVAIVGGGVTGIACSWELRKHDYHVDIYESEAKLGGHANSVPFTGNGMEVNIDTGFVVMDDVTYPSFNAFLGELGVETIPTDMSLAVSTVDGAFDWCSYSISHFIGSFSRLLRPWFWRLMFDIIRFSLFAEDALLEVLEERRPSNRISVANPQDEDEGAHGDLQGNGPGSEQLESIGAYLKREGYSDRFIKYYLIPMVAAPWCTDPDEFALKFPAKVLIRFMLERGLLDTVARRLRWRSFRSGSRSYVEAFQRSLPAHHHLHLGTPVHRVKRTGENVSLIFGDHSRETFDYLVLAVHANQALALLGDDATSLERKILGCFKTSKNICYLHSDESYLPGRLSARAAWNCFIDDNNKNDDLCDKMNGHEKDPLHDHHSTKISITFDMNKLQAIPFPGEPGSPGRILVTMNPIRRGNDGSLIIPHSVQSSHMYYHPLINSKSILMGRHISSINGISGICFAGAWIGYGFHEDGFRAGVNAARILIDGRQNTPSLDLTAEIEEGPVVRGGFGRRMLRMIMLMTWRLAIHAWRFMEAGGVKRGWSTLAGLGYRRNTS